MIKQMTDSWEKLINSFYINKHLEDCLEFKKAGVVVHVCNPSTLEAVRRVANLRLAWTTWQDPISKNKPKSQVPVVHTCNPSYSGSRDQEDHGSKPGVGK
jgi:hypothetical protein